MKYLLKYRSNYHWLLLIEVNIFNQFILLVFLQIILKNRALRFETVVQFQNLLCGHSHKKNNLPLGRIHKPISAEGAKNKNPPTSFNWLTIFWHLIFKRNSRFRHSLLWVLRTNWLEISVLAACCCCIMKTKNLMEVPFRHYWVKVTHPKSNSPHWWCKRSHSWK